MWRANGNTKKTYTDLDGILHPHPCLFKEGFGAGLTPFPFPPGPGGGPKTLKS